MEIEFFIGMKKNMDSMRHIFLKKNNLYIFISFVVIFILFLCDISCGACDVSLLDFITTFCGHNAQGEMVEMIWGLRYPAALMAIISGALLSVTGCQLQNILNNRLADSYTLGLSSAATLGCSFVVLGFLNTSGTNDIYIINIASFAVSLLCGLFIIYMSHSFTLHSHAIILIGVAVKIFLDGLVHVGFILGSDQDVASIIFLSMGSLQRATPGKIIMVLILAIFPLLWFFKFSLNTEMLQIGKDHSRAMGVCPKKHVIYSIICVCILVASVISVVGPIPFVGLIAPNLARTLPWWSSHRGQLLSSMIWGVILIQLASLSARLILSYSHIPIYITMSVIGGPCLIFFILKGRGLLCYR